MDPVGSLGQAVLASNGMRLRPEHALPLRDLFNVLACGHGATMTRRDKGLSRGVRATVRLSMGGSIPCLDRLYSFW